MDGLREEVDRIQAELATAEKEWLEWTIARERVSAVLSAPGGDSADAVATERPGGAGTEAEVRASPPMAAKPKSQVPVWREGLARTALSADYQRVPSALADRVRLGQGPLTCQEMTSAFGMDVVPAKVEVAVEGEAPGRTGLAGRAGAGPVHARARRERARRRVMIMVIDQ
ncbi:hypothetical protein AB0E67_35700 [Streptomyces sp. NPDC032161]|uniref:hypothetical protein n=1 Tax=unclassified Streptomyces TaxID=2593676 RepID=UPI0033F75C28